MLAGAREAVWTLAFACCVCFCAAGSYNPDATRLVDYFQPSENLTNFIFRGDEPLDDNHTFAYDEMVAAFRERAAAANLTFPSRFYLLDFSLLNIFEFEDINAEKQFFEENPHLGEYYNWVTIGTLLDPMIFPYEIRKEMAERLPEWQFDQLPSLMDKLHSMIQQTYNESLVIYIHCEAGHDRTGEVSGAYYMKWLNWSYQQTLVYDDWVAHREIYKESLFAMTWYCWYLATAQAYPLNCTIPSNMTLF